MPPSSSRRRFLAAAAVGATPIAGWPVDADDTPPSPASLSPTEWIDVDHPRIRALAGELASGAPTPEGVAVRVHDAVRDRIAFGLAPAFYAMKASEVLDAGVGFCNTKTTLFQALLRANGIPTRTRMFDLSAQVLQGLFEPGTASVDHAVTDVWLGGRWIGVDSYVVDKPLARAAAERLAAEGRRVGYGIHAAGTSEWDGRTGARIQCVPGSEPAVVLGEHGVFADVGDFYTRATVARNRLGGINRWLIRLGAASINRRIAQVRGAPSATVEP